MRLITVPVSTVEKPLTPIDYCAALDQCITPAEVASFCERCPVEVRNDERFSRAVAEKLAAFKEERQRRRA